jgi:hypothetical protein
MATLRLCSIPDCGKRANGSRGFCISHYERLKKYGDPCVPLKQIPSGTTLRWLKAHTEYDGDECLTWPFSTDRKGYGKLWYEGRLRPASRIMCTLVHGEPPQEGLDAAHSCGKGHEGCVNPKHLRWATRSENHMDKVAHGTILRGRKQTTSILTEDDVRAIRSLHGRMPRKEIAKRFGTSPGNVNHIHRRDSWAWLE